MLRFLYVLPNLSNFGFITEPSHGQSWRDSRWRYRRCLRIVYIGILLSAAVLIFQRGISNERLLDVLFRL